MLAVEIKDLTKKYGDLPALKGLSFSVEQGTLFGIIGADGAGKSTLLRILATLISPTSGSALLLGKDTITQFNALRATIGYMPQKFSLYQDLSVRENMLFFADIFGVGMKERQERMQRLLAFSRLDSCADRRAGQLSGGMKQKLALSCALIHTPQILILDEPTTGVDPVSRKEFWEILFDLKRQGMTILVSTPYMDEASKCDDLMILHEGHIVRRGAPAELLRHYPHTLYAVHGRDSLLACPQHMQLPSAILLAYPSEGTIHCAVDAKEITNNATETTLKTLFPEAVRIEQIQPGIEDLLFLLLSEEGK